MRERRLGDIHLDEAGGPTVEYILVAGLVVFTFGLCVPLALTMIRTYFYRCAEVVSLPFP
jgi:hypothetical protein